MALEALVSRRYIVPEVIQTPAMDGAAAALEAMFGGFDVRFSHAGIRAASRTAADRSSIEMLEATARRLGLQCRRSVLPLGVAFAAGCDSFPAIAMVRTSDGPAQPVLVWRAHGPWLQIMDPAVGRLWIQRRRFVKSLLETESPLCAAARADLVNSAAFSRAITRRMRALGEPARVWDDPAQQDAALQFGMALRDSRKLRRGRDTREFLSLCANHPDEIPREYWSLPDPSRSGGRSVLRGVEVLAAPGGLNRTDPPIAVDLAQRPRRGVAPAVWGPVWSAIRQSGPLLPVAVAFAWSAAAAGTVIEALLFRGLFDLGRHLQDTAGRIGMVTALLVFLDQGALVALAHLALPHLG